jgi:signal transduction histidine kinase
MPDRRPNLIARGLRRHHLIALDAAAAVGLVLLTGAAGSTHTATLSFTGPDWVLVAVAAGLGLPIAVRRVWPLPALGIVSAALIAATVTGIAWGRSGFAFMLPMIFVCYSVGAQVPWRRSIAAFVASLIGTSAALLMTTWAVPVRSADEPVWTGLLVFYWMLLAACWGAGLAMRARRAYAASSAEQLARQAVSDERLRIARELHDIVAHSLSLITVKAAVANHIAAARPDEAQDALRVIEATSRDTLTEMRRLLGVLRSDAAVPDLAPSPGLAGLPELAERAGLAGVRVDLAVEGSAELPDGVELSVYRIVQEGLTNVVKHAAPARCRVSVTVDSGEARIEIVDDGPGVRTLPGSASGHGLVGMRERVTMYGGDFAAGPRAEGGFAVSARLPYLLAGEPA